MKWYLSILLRGLSLLWFYLYVGSLTAIGQTAYFVDGYHGGKWGHYPPKYTSFIVEQLQKHPNWKINLEIEPATWDWAKEVDPEGYTQFATLISDQSATGRIEYVNPAYGQAYLYNISGESIIRQFAYGMEELKSHFPALQFTTYSSEEPCFTSALPQILRSFGFKYASLKNPNTCWGGYVRAHGKEVLNWVGPDGTAILTVPRYGIESLKEGSTWETIASYNGKDFINKALQAGIEHPVGMCLQDAGWKNGPWLGAHQGDYQPTAYTTWRNYFENISTKTPLDNWRLSQEDIQVSLVWGAQVLQRIAQQVRTAEHKIFMAEKYATLNKMLDNRPWPAAAFKQAWLPLLLAQHHDCWIVPYNKVDSLNWAGKVAQWTAVTGQIADSVLNSTGAKQGKLQTSILVRNVLPYERTGLVSYSLSAAEIDTSLVVVDAKGQALPTQWRKRKTADGFDLLFVAKVPAMGQAFYKLKKKDTESKPFVKVTPDKGDIIVSSDLYTIRFNPKRGGVITSLQSKALSGREFVDTSDYKGFNELKGFFYEENKFRSSTEHPATVAIIEQGAARFKLQIKGEIAGQPFTQEMTLVRGEPRIDFRLQIDWQGQPRIGQYNDEQLKLENRKKAFYNDRYKLLLLFPANLAQQQVAKNAPFDVTESTLSNTFFSSWDSIKNNVILDWVDVTDKDKAYGLALFSDHTTSYAHGEDHPLGLTVQYAGKGLWGRDYEVDGPTQMAYSILPHQQDWSKAQIWYANDCLSNPLLASDASDMPDQQAYSMFAFSKKGYALSALQYDGDNILLRIFNVSGDDSPVSLYLGFEPAKVQLEALNGERLQTLPPDQANPSTITLSMPRFGFRTLRIIPKKDNLKR